VTKQTVSQNTYGHSDSCTYMGAVDASSGATANEEGSRIGRSRPTTLGSTKTASNGRKHPSPVLNFISEICL
jgi:hypothetical protein